MQETVKTNFCPAPQLVHYKMQTACRLDRNRNTVLWKWWKVKHSLSGKMEMEIVCVPVSN